MVRCDCPRVHPPPPSPYPPQTLAGALATAVESGLARSVGVSNYSEAELRETHRVLAERGVPLAVNQVQGVAWGGMWGVCVRACVLPPKQRDKFEAAREFVAPAPVLFKQTAATLHPYC